MAVERARAPDASVTVSETAPECAAAVLEVGAAAAREASEARDAGAFGAVSSAPGWHRRSRILHRRNRRPYGRDPIAQCLDLVIQLAEGKAVELARLCRERMRDSEWQLLREFAAEVTALGETLSAGEAMIVVPAVEADRTLRQLGLRPKR